MLDRDDRRLAAEYLRAYAKVVRYVASEGPPLESDADGDELERLAEGLTEEPAYDFETAAVERGQVLAEFIEAAAPLLNIDHNLRAVHARAEEVMEGALEPCEVSDVDQGSAGERRIFAPDTGTLVHRRDEPGRVGVVARQFRGYSHAEPTAWVVWESGPLALYRVAVSDLAAL